MLAASSSFSTARRPTTRTSSTTTPGTPGDHDNRTRTLAEPNDVTTTEKHTDYLHLNRPALPRATRRDAGCVQQLLHRPPPDNTHQLNDHARDARQPRQPDPHARRTQRRDHNGEAHGLPPPKPSRTTTRHAPRCWLRPAASPPPAARQHAPAQRPRPGRPATTTTGPARSPNPTT